MKTFLFILFLFLSVFSDQYVTYHQHTPTASEVLSLKDTGRAIAVYIVNNTSKKFTVDVWERNGNGSCYYPDPPVGRYNYYIRDFALTRNIDFYPTSGAQGIGLRVCLIPAVSAVVTTNLKFSFSNGEYFDPKEAHSGKSTSYTCDMICNSETTTVYFTTSLRRYDTMVVRDTTYPNTAVEEPVLSPAPFTGTYRLFDVAGRLLAKDVTERQALTLLRTRGIYILQSPAITKRICRI